MSSTVGAQGSDTAGDANPSAVRSLNKLQARSRCVRVCVCVQGEIHRQTFPSCENFLRSLPSHGVGVVPDVPPFLDGVQSIRALNQLPDRK